MVEFWTDHFNIFFGAEYQEALKPVDDREVIRPHALGSFPDLLWASAHSPAMLLYLDNAVSVAAAPNQNYARELLELHTLSPGYYTQTDIEEVARCFTGWTVNGDWDSRDLGRFLYEPDLHDDGAKTVLGREIPAGGGKRDGEIVLEILTTDAEIAPITARFVSRKLARYFWGYDPPEALVTSVADAYLATGGDIRAMVRAALDETWMTQAAPKLKRPYHLLLSALRSRPSTILNAQRVSWVLRILGHHPYGWGPPDGYPDDANYWGELVIHRWSLGAGIVEQDDIAPMDWGPLLAPMPLEEFLDNVSGYLFNGALPADQRETLRSFVAAGPEDAFRRRLTIGLAFGAEAFQWH